MKVKVNDKTNDLLREELKKVRQQINDSEESKIQLKKMEQAIKESEARYKFIIDKSKEIILILDKKGKILFANKAALYSGGYSKKEIIGKSITNFLTKDSIKKALYALSQEFIGSLQPEMVLKIRTKSGEIRYLEFAKGSTFIRERGILIGILVSARDITESRQMEKALRESEERYRTLVQYSGTAVALIKEDGTVAIVNKRLEELSGYSREEIQGKNFTDFLSEDDKRRLIGYHKARRAGNVAPTAYKAVAKMKDGELRTILLTVGLIPGTKKSIASFIDITEMEKLERDLEESEEKYRTLAENVNVGVYRNTVGPKGKFIEVNPAIVKMFGYESRDEFFTVNVADLYQNPVDREKFNEKMLRNGFVRGEELHLKKKDGTPLIGSVSTVAVKDEKGEVKYYDGIVEDITERKWAEKELKKSEIKYKSLVEEAAAGIATIQLNGTFAFVNKTLCEMIGYSQEEMINRPFSDFIHTEDKKSISEIFKKAFKDPELKPHLEFRIIHKKGHSVFIYSKPIPLIYENKVVGFTAIITDLTERKRAEEEIHRSYQIQTILNKLLSISLEDISLEEMLERTIEQIFSISWLVLESKGAIFLVEDEPKMLVMKAQHGVPTYIKTLCARVAFGECLCGQAASSGKIVFKDYIEKPRNKRYKGFSPHGHYCVPIISSNKKVLGVICLFLKQGHRQNKREEDFLQAVANVLAGIIERKRAEDALKTSEEKYRNLIDNALVGVYKTNLKGDILYANQALAKMLGYESPEELLSNGSLSSYKNPKDREVLINNLKKIGKVSNFEVELVTKRGETKNILLNASIEKDIISGMMMDITKLKQAEKIQRVLFNISQATSLSENLDELLKIIHQQLGSLIDTTNFYIALYDEKNEIYTFPYYVDQYDDDFSPQPLKKSLTDYVRKTSKPLIVDEKHFCSA